MTNKKIILIIAIIILLAGTILYIVEQNKQNSSSFKTEYEYYNNKKWHHDEQEGKYLNIKIDNDNPIIYLTDKNIVKQLQNGNKIIYFGFPDCNWCRAAIPVLLKAAKDNGVEKIYYYNFKKVRESYEQGKNDEKGAIYEQIIDILKNNITSEFETGPKKGEKRLSAPTVVLIKDGKVQNFHYRTVDTHKNYNKNLTKKEQGELYKIYEEIIENSIMCSTDC